MSSRVYGSCYSSTQYEQACYNYILGNNEQGVFWLCLLRHQEYLNTYMYNHCLLYFPRNNSLCIQYTFRSFYKMVATNKIERYLVKINLINVAKTQDLRVKTLSWINSHNCYIQHQFTLLLKHTRIYIQNDLR